MQFIKVKTRAFLPPKDDIYDLIDTSVPRLKEGDVLLITSKIIAIHQGRCVKISETVNKDDLIIKEAEKYIPRSEVPKEYVLLTVKEHTLIPSSGIDESNGNGYYILWPKRANAFAKEVCNYLKRKWKVKKLAVIITDSHTIPLRRGVLGISVGFYGLKPLRDYRGKKDIFGRKLKITQTNIPDALAAIGVFLMGEGSERTPILIIRGLEGIEFTNRKLERSLFMPEREDIYAPLLKVFRKKA